MSINGSQRPVAQAQCLRWRDLEAASVETLPIFLIEAIRASRFLYVRGIVRRLMEYGIPDEIRGQWPQESPHLKLTREGHDLGAKSRDF
jgi:hypothetical protein